MDKIDLMENIDLINVIARKDNEISTHFIKSIITISDNFANCYKIQKDNLPYHLNLIDELHANENAHSRILVKLFGYKLNNKFLILESFVNFIRQKKEKFDFNHTFSQPKITPEKHRIDALVLDKDFAIIVENKIHNAKDQSEQLKNYIQKVKNLKIKEENIFVIYLSRLGKKPTENSFPDELRNNFKNRYIELSYRYDIINWLEFSVLPQINEKENFIASALKQYVDHLQGMFNIRKNNQKMNEELIKTIEEQLNLQSDYNENIKTINTTIKNLDKTKEYLNNALKINWFKSWHSQLLKDYPNYQIIPAFDNLNNYPKVVIALEYKNIKFSLSIEMETNLYFGIGRHYSTDTKNNVIAEKFDDILVDFKKSDWWYGWKYVDFDNAYSKLKSLLDKVIDKIKQ